MQGFRGNTRASSSVATIAAMILLGFLLAVSNGARANSTLAKVGAGKTSAHLDFRIVIPSVLIVDTASGTVFSNDARMLVRLGATDAVISPSQNSEASQSTRLAAAPAWAKRMGINGVKMAAGASGGAAGLIHLSQASGSQVLCMP